ncbi:hypothetical protein [Roseibium aggregatum]|uniref:hypothetical protein n=1 Tax=Roseibium aggregatum TaxID=187304 RepID=UPI0025AD1BE6|nr:hypothetical protein [Roseibium aggregatum]WJS05206.1 hypothetical protein QUB73_13255 [Roseibium aggregatum]
MPAPFEIIAAPFTAWWAPIGTAFPLIDAAPAVDWVLIGTNGPLNYSEDGVTVMHEQQTNETTPLGSTGAVKAFRTNESQQISFTVWDMSLELYRLGLNSNEVTTVAAGVGTAGYKSIPLYRGHNVANMALLIRGASPYADDMSMQYQIPRCYQSGSPEPVHQKGNPAGLEFTFRALTDLNAATEDARFGHIIAQHQAALP